MADDYPDWASGTVWLNYPGLNATLEEPGDVDRFYYGDATPPASFRLTNAQFEIARLTVRDHNLNVVAVYYGPAADAYVNLQPEPLLSYYVSVEGFNADGTPATGTYTISAGAWIDDHGDDATTTSSIVIDGAPATGVIDVWQDWDWFRIDGMNGDPVRIELASAAFDRVIIWVVDQYGNILASHSGPSAGVSLVAPPNATHIRILGFDAAGNYDTGAYSLVATSIPDDHGDTVATATPITIGGPPVSAVNEGGDVDIFSFEAQAGVPIVFDWITVPPNTTANYSLYDQYGRSLNWLNSVMDASHYHVFTLPISGTYYLQLQAGSGTSFQIVAATDDYSDTLPTNGVLTVDGPAVTARHDFEGDFDVFAINIEEAGTYRFEASPLLLWWLHELLALYDADGNLIDARVLIYPGEGLTLQVDAPGTYYLGVESALDGFINNENLYTVTAYSVTDDYGETLTTAGSITVGGGTVNGSINYNEDIDWLRFDVTAGQVIRIEYNPTGFFVPNISILDDQGVLRTWIDDSPYDTGVYCWAVTQSGTYYLTVGDFLGDQYMAGTGTYTVSMSVVPGESAFPDPLTIGTPTSGTLTYAGNDNDLFIFTAQAGQTILFDAEADYSWRLSIYNFTTSEFLVLEPQAASHAIGYTFSETGSYYLTFSGVQPIAAGTTDLGAYTLYTSIISDDAGSTAAGAMTLVLDGAAANGVVHFENDIDWFAITVDAGEVVHFNVTHDSSISGLHWGIVGVSSGISPMPGGGYAHRFDQAGTYYIQVEGAYWEEVGGSYAVTAASIADDYRSDVNTTASMIVGGPAFAGQLEYSSDLDWVAIELEAGETYLFTASGSTTPGAELNGSINIYDETGVQLDATGLFTGASTELLFTASYTGTHYVGVSGQIGFSSPYTLTAANFTPSLIETISPGLPALPDDSFDHTQIGPANVINVYFAEAGDEFGAIISDGWFTNEIDAVMAVLSTFEAYLNIDFQVTDFLPNADVVLTTFNDANSLSVFQRADWDVPIPVIGFSYAAPTWTSAALAPGGLGAAVVLNAIGYALGLAFPHAPEEDSYAMEGVTSPYDTGDFDMNQGVYTIMSFNDGWVTSPYGLSPSDAYGWQATPMALDIAALQALYGANVTANADATTYTLGDANAAGAAWRAVWDTSGVDTIIYTGSGAATIDLRAATLQYESGGAGFLSYVQGVHGGFSIANGVIIENATGGSGNDTLIGNAIANVLTGSSGDDLLNGGFGADTMIGGDGDDTYVVDNTGDVTSETSPAGGVDTVQSSTTRTLGANLENLTLTGAAAISGYGNTLNNAITGNSAANTLVGGDGNDTLDGGAGADAMTGNLGDDAYYVDDAGDTVSEGNSVGGTDHVYASVSFNLGPTGYAEHLTLTGAAAINGVGNNLANIITGNSAANVLSGAGGNDTLLGGDGADTLDGGAGADAMTGGDGDDTYMVDNAGDAVAETSALGGIDTVQSSLTRSLGANLENLVLTGAGAINGYGNALDNTITGNAAANALYGGDGNDVLNGGAGADVMVGNFGDDSYYVDNAGDTVSEGNIAGGVDTVFASVSFNLGPTGFADHLTLTGASAINATGNSLANTLIGNAAGNILTGNSGNDTLNAGDGNDTLYGGDGNDVLDGGIGADAMIGNLGDDTYYVDHAGDTVSEGSNVGGSDIVYASVSFNLAPTGFVENLTLTGADAINATGNNQANTLTGNSAANTLTGASGADSFVFASALGGGNIDAIADFSVADDTIVLSNTVFTGLSAGALDANAFAIGAAAADADDRIIYDSATGALYFDADGNGSGSAVQFATLTAGLALTSGDFIIGGP
jgi:Ca2+-binding RTX toxin-like protein